MDLGRPDPHFAGLNRIRVRKIEPISSNLGIHKLMFVILEHTNYEHQLIKLEETFNIWTCLNIWRTVPIYIILWKKSKYKPLFLLSRLISIKLQSFINIIDIWRLARIILKLKLITIEVQSTLFLIHKSLISSITVNNSAPRLY